MADQTTPSDTVIGLPVYKGEAEAVVLCIYADAAAAPSDEGAAAVKRAVIYLTAALLAPAIPHLLHEAEGGYDYTTQAVDWSARAAELRTLGERNAHAALALVTPSEPLELGRRPTQFKAIAGRRFR